jgi:hypothetical protein
MGAIRIVWYLERYHDIKTSDAIVYRVCKQHGLNKLPNCVGRCHRRIRRRTGSSAFPSGIGLACLHAVEPEGWAFDTRFDAKRVLDATTRSDHVEILRVPQTIG